MRVSDAATPRETVPRREPVAHRAGATLRRARWAVLPGIAALFLAAGAWLMYETRGTTLWFDEWQWVTEYRDNSLSGFLAPHNGHPTIIPVAIYRLLFATVGIAHSAPYRAIGIAVHLACAGVLLVYAARRVGLGLGLAGAAVILLLGPGWQNIIWPLQVGWVVGVAATLGALLALDRRDRRGDVAACVLLVISLAASGPAIALAAGVAVEVALTRGRRGAWIVAVPAVLLAAWWVAFQDSGAVRRSLTGAPAFAADSAAATASALAGLAGPLISVDPVTLGWGRPLAVAGAVVLVWRLWRLWPLSPRVVGLLVILAAFWGLTAVQRAGLGPAESSRYVYVAGVFVVALAAELAAGVVLSRRGWALAAAATAFVLIANVGAMRTAASFLRDQALLARTGLAAVDVARPVVSPDHVLRVVPGYPYVTVHARDYFAIERDLGTPATDVAGLAVAPEAARLAADAELVRMHGLAVQPGAAPRQASAPPAVDAAAPGAVQRSGGCVAYAPPAARAVTPAPAIELTVPAGGVAIAADGGPATVTVRRFAAGFPDAPVGEVAAGGSGVLRIRPDAAPVPWHVRVAPDGRVRVCALGG